jgi:hypothetical protein
VVSEVKRCDGLVAEQLHQAVRQPRYVLLTAAVDAEGAPQLHPPRGIKMPS